MEIENEKNALYERLLMDFSALPKPNMNPTFLDICQIRRGRFEERCSQILRFFFKPDQPHKLHDLFLKSLLEVLEVKDKCFYRESTTKVITEEVTSDQKRIDLTIIADNFVVAIENKVEAELYNPLDSYRKYIEKTYPEKKHIYVVLSVRRITNKNELDKMDEQGYSYVNYEDLFSVVKKNLGSYAAECDQAYLTFLLDFIRTIDNRYYNKNMEEINNFYFDNHNNIDDLLKGYQNFNNEMWQRQCDAIATICGKLQQKTNAHWWIYEKWDLGVTFNGGTDKNIGIEANFETDFQKRNPLGLFKAFITVWNKSCFAPFEKLLIDKYGSKSIDYNPQNDSNRIYLHLPPMENASIEEIVDKMQGYYNDLKEINEQVIR